MTTRWIVLGAVLLAVAGLYLPGCRSSRHDDPDVILVDREPPPDRVEVKPPPPAVGHVWIPGHWVARGRDFDWVPGHWKPVPRGKSAWAPGHWERRPRGWVWIDGHWR